MYEVGVIVIRKKVYLKLWSDVVSPTTLRA